MPDARRLARLARVREVERRLAAARAAASGGEHERLEALRRRSRDLSSLYAARAGAPDGAALAGLFAFRRELEALSARAAGDAEAARVLAERARSALAVAQNRRDRVQERLEGEQRILIQREQAAADLARSLNEGDRTSTPARRKAP